MYNILRWLKCDPIFQNLQPFSAWLDSQDAVSAIESLYLEI